MAKSVRVAFTVDKSIFNAFKKSIPKYTSVPAVMAVLMQELVNGFSQGRSLTSTFDLLKHEVQTDLFESDRLPDDPTIL